MQGIAATPSEGLMKQANDAYQAANYAAAIETYESVLKNGQQSKELFYNLGNAYFKQNNIGLAILNYEKAKKIGSDEDITHNLEITRLKIIEDVEQVDDFFLNRWWRGLRNLARSGSWSGLAISNLWLAVLGLSAWLVVNNRKYKKWGFTLASLFIPLTILFFLLAKSANNYEKEGNEAIIISKETPFKNAPDNGATTVIILHEGIKVEILDKIGDWYKIKTSNGEQGWLAIGAVEKI
jgi:tetratricopeptide (TPR) repeat protein